VEVEFIRTRGIRKEDRAQELLAKRGGHPGLVCIFSAMEPSSTYKRGTTNKAARRILYPMTVSVCTITSISWTKNSASATCGYRPGCPADYRSV
jgi:hypothetical protein